MDVFLLWDSKQLDNDAVLAVTPRKLTSGRDHRAAARDGVERRFEAWDNQRGRELPHAAPSRDEMRDACLAAIKKWIPK